MKTIIISGTHLPNSLIHHAIDVVQSIDPVDGAIVISGNREAICGETCQERHQFRSFVGLPQKTRQCPECLASVEQTMVDIALDGGQ